MTYKLETVLDGLSFGEAPRWHNDQLYFSDMHAHRVEVLGLDGTHQTVAAFDGPVSGLGWLPDGRLLVVSMHDKRVLRAEKDGSFAVHGILSG